MYSRLIRTAFMTYRRVAQVAVRHFRSLILIYRVRVTRNAPTLPNCYIQVQREILLHFFFSSEFFVVHMLRFESVDMHCAVSCDNMQSRCCHCWLMRCTANQFCALAMHIELKYIQNWDHLVIHQAQRGVFLGWVRSLACIQCCRGPATVNVVDVNFVLVHIENSVLGVWSLFFFV